MLIELITSTLPWKGMGRRDSGNLKEIILERVLLKVINHSISFC